MRYRNEDQRQANAQIDPRPRKKPEIGVGSHAQQINHGEAGDDGAGGDQITRLDIPETADDEHHPHCDCAARRNRQACPGRRVAVLILQNCGSAWVVAINRAPVPSMTKKHVPNWRLVSIWRSISGRARLSSHGMNRSNATADIAANVTMKFDPNQSSICPRSSTTSSEPRKIATRMSPPDQNRDLWPRALAVLFSSRANLVGRNKWRCCK